MSINQLDDKFLLQIGLASYPKSYVQNNDSEYLLVYNREKHEKQLIIRGDLLGFNGSFLFHHNLLLCPLNFISAENLRKRLCWLNPRVLGTVPSIGFGDRLGLATPGHVRSVEGSGIKPIFAQQSVRENTRTGRTPQQVLDDAMWGIFQEGWQRAWGADADHIKNSKDIEAFMKAGYSFYTLDPSAFVDNQADQDSLDNLYSKFKLLPWENLKDSPDGLLKRYSGLSYNSEVNIIRFNHEVIIRAAVKYGRALAHIVHLNHCLKGYGQDYELEVSVDETDTPTSHAEHIYIANELKRLGVVWISLAPRFPGRFEKGVDYIGDLTAFSKDIKVHAYIAQDFGPYKLSLHSGSDKFSIYPLTRTSRNQTG